MSGSHPVLIPVSRSYSKLEGRSPTRSSPLRHWCIAAPVRLACLIHAASVRSEPESNSPNKNLKKALPLRFDVSEESILLLSETFTFQIYFVLRFSIFRPQTWLKAHRTIQFSRIIGFRRISRADFGAQSLIYHRSKLLSNPFSKIFQKFFPELPLPAVFSRLSGATGI